jgi:hypothetical protein
VNCRSSLDKMSKESLSDITALVPYQSRVAPRLSDGWGHGLARPREREDSPHGERQHEESRSRGGDPGLRGRGGPRHPVAVRRQEPEASVSESQRAGACFRLVSISVASSRLTPGQNPEATQWRQGGAWKRKPKNLTALRPPPLPGALRPKPPNSSAIERS